MIRFSLQTRDRAYDDYGPLAEKLPLRSALQMDHLPSCSFVIPWISCGRNREYSRVTLASFFHSFATQHIAMFSHIDL